MKTQSLRSVLSGFFNPERSYETAVKSEPQNIEPQNVEVWNRFAQSF